MTTRRARCLCGAVRVTIRGDLDDIAACHCSQCRRWSGHVWAAALADRLEITGERSAGAVALLDDRAKRRRVGIVFQDPDDQLFSADVARDVSFGPMNLGLPEAEVAARVAPSVRSSRHRPACRRRCAPGAGRHGPADVRPALSRRLARHGR